MIESEVIIRKYGEELTFTRKGSGPIYVVWTMEGVFMETTLTNQQRTDLLKLLQG